MDGRKLSTMLAAVALALGPAPRPLYRRPRRRHGRRARGAFRRRHPGDARRAGPRAPHMGHRPLRRPDRHRLGRRRGHDQRPVVLGQPALGLRRAGENVQCRIVFNRLIAYDWARFCTVLVHEYGHLAGRAHTGTAWTSCRRSTAARCRRAWRSPIRRRRRRPGRAAASRRRRLPPALEQLVVGDVATRARARRSRRRAAARRG